MAFGYSIPTRGPLGNRAAMVAMATHADKLGYRYLAVPDHLIVPVDIESRYPYSANGDFPGQAVGECYEQLTLMAYLAAVTTRAHLLSSVMVVPHRGAVHTAKILSSLDQLSDGRLVVGVGTGWMREEFEAVQAPDFDARGKVTNEWIEAWKVLWSEDDPAYDGEHVKFANLSFLPKPVQKPNPPIWVGGESGPAMRRTVQLGDAWYPIGANPRHPLGSPALLKAGIEKLHRIAEKHGRDPSSIDIVYWANWFDESNPASEAPDGARMIYTGSADQIAEDIRTLADMGVKHQLFNFQRNDLAASIGAIESFTDSIIPKTDLKLDPPA